MLVLALTIEVFGASYAAPVVLTCAIAHALSRGKPAGSSGHRHRSSSDRPCMHIGSRASSALVRSTLSVQKKQKKETMMSVELQVGV